MAKIQMWIRLEYFMLLLIISLVYDLDSDVNQISTFDTIRYVQLIISVVYGKD